MRAVRIPTTGPVEVIELGDLPAGDVRALLAQLYAVIGCDSVERVKLWGIFEAWLDETRADGGSLNHRATHLARRCGVRQAFHGTVIILAANHDTGRPVGLTHDQVQMITRITPTSPPSTPGTVRVEVTNLAALGPLPPENASEDLDHLFDAYEQQLLAITGPVSIDEARVLIRLFPATEETCFGMAWTLLHLIESCPDWFSDEDLGDGPWPDRLRQRQGSALSS